MKPIKSSKQPTSNSQQPTQNGTQPISNFKRHISNSLEQIGLNKFTANFTQKSLAASQKIFFLSLPGEPPSNQSWCTSYLHKFDEGGCGAGVGSEITIKDISNPVCFAGDSSRVHGLLQRYQRINRSGLLL